MKKIFLAAILGLSLLIGVSSCSKEKSLQLHPVSTVSIFNTNWYVYKLDSSSVIKMYQSPNKPYWTVDSVLPFAASNPQAKIREINGDTLTLYVTYLNDTTYTTYANTKLITYHVLPISTDSVNIAITSSDNSVSSTYFLSKNF